MEIQTEAFFFSTLGIFLPICWQMESVLRGKKGAAIDTAGVVSHKIERLLRMHLSNPEKTHTFARHIQVAACCTSHARKKKMQIQQMEQKRNRDGQNRYRPYLYSSSEPWFLTNLDLLGRESY